MGGADSVTSRAHTALGRLGFDLHRYPVRLEYLDGVLTMEGELPDLAGVLCWWAPGTRDVMNALEVDAPEEDNDDEISDAVRIVLEKDPLLDASEIGVSTERSRVTLRGLVASEEQRRIAENDAWCVFGVNDVSNEIEVSPDVASARWRRVAAS
ncbi:BON domain-containing protein [Sorangium sp. So ce542]|uniref:BON domain-containing protein n=1 Tax=Sorangium sp. So ce542 TaxID=3133316 RepID=UPI003F624559